MSLPKQLHSRAVVLQRVNEFVTDNRSISFSEPSASITTSTNTMSPSVAFTESRDVIVEITHVGICGSDVEYWKRGRIGDFVLKAPMVIGHESSGIVRFVGKEVTTLKPGDRVALEPGIPCFCCATCLKGSYNLCSKMRFFATPPIDGSLQTYVRHPEAFCHLLPSEVSLEEGALCEPLSVGIHACQRSGVSYGSHVLILGAGPIGLVCGLVARAFGATWIGIRDVQPKRLEFASQQFQFVPFLSDESKSELEMLHDINSQLSGSSSISVAIDCTGRESAVRLGMKATVAGGCFCCVGLHDPEMKLPLLDTAVREVDIRGIFRYRNTYPTCIAMLQSQRLKAAKQLITHRFMTDFTRTEGGKEGLGKAPVEVVKAFEAAFNVADSGAIKVMIVLGTDEKTQSKL